MDNIRKILVLFVLTWCIALCSHAQVVHITGSVTRAMKTMDGGKQNTPVSIPVYIFDNYTEAERQAREYRLQSMRQGGYATIKSNDIATPDYEGHFEADIATGGALLVIDEGSPRVIKITSALKYDIQLKSDSADGILLKNTDIYGERRGMQMRELPPIDDGPNLHWNVSVSIPAYYGNSRARLIFQPAVIDCQTEDTIQYLEPMVFDGKKYHLAQIRRKSFDFQRNDSLARYTQSQPLSEKPFSFQWETTYPKPNPEHSYKWVSEMILEDYTHVYYDDDTKEGTCNSRKPWKMLDIGFARKDIVLDERYYEQAKAQLRETDRDLQLTFEIGKAILTDDSVNMQTINHLVRELRSYGRQLMNVKIQGTASPDGNLDRNTELANKRAQRALTMISQYVSSASMQVAPPKVYSWMDVADSLDGRRLNSVATELRELAQRNAVKGIRQLMVETPEINQILQNLRLMKCSYTIRQNKVMDPEEALWAYYHDKSYEEGGENRFSNGDYYHLFRQITDSAELRKLTYRAYRELKDRTTSKYSPFAAYIANRVASYAIADDEVDTDILAPYIDMKSSLEAQRQISFDNEYKYTINRRELVANQAVMYFRAMKLGAASHLADKLPDTEDFRDIKMFTDLETLFFKQNKTASEQQRAMQALRYAMQTSDVNRAVLSFELAPELGKTYEEVEPLINALPDDNPKKWYMKGVIAANSSETSEDDFMELVAKYGAEKAILMKENQTPSFIAYMQHCFDLDSTYYNKYYLSDANISDEIKKKYPYKPEKAQEYREKFETLIQKGQRNNDEKQEGHEDN